MITPLCCRVAGAELKSWVWDGAAGLWRGPIPPEFVGSAMVRQLYVAGQRLRRPTAPLRGNLNATTAADLAVLTGTQTKPNCSALVGYVCAVSPIFGLLDFPAPNGL